LKLSVLGCWFPEARIGSYQQPTTANEEPEAPRIALEKEVSTSAAKEISNAD